MSGQPHDEAVQLPQPVPQPVRRRYPDAPLVGVGAAVFDEQGRVLLVRRGRPPRAGHWGLPGGLLELGETLEAGVRREVAEECGIEIAVGGVAGVFEPIILDDAGRIEYHYVVIDYWARLAGGEAVAADDAADVAWVEMAALAAYALTPDSHEVVLDAYALFNAAS